MNGTSTLAKRAAGKLGMFAPASAAVAIVVLLVVVPPTATMVATLTEPVSVPGDATIRAWDLELELSKYGIEVDISHEFRAEDGVWVAEYQIRLDGDRDSVVGVAEAIPDADIIHLGSPIFMFMIYGVWAAASAAVMVWRAWLDVSNFLLECALFIGSVTAMVTIMRLFGGLFPVL